MKILRINQLVQIFDWKRLLKEVLNPISNGLEGRYKRYDWEKDSLVGSHIVSASGIVIIEGVYATRQELAECMI